MMDIIILSLVSVAVFLLIIILVLNILRGRKKIANNNDFSEEQEEYITNQLKGSVDIVKENISELERRLNSANNAQSQLLLKTNTDNQDSLRQSIDRFSDSQTNNFSRLEQKLSDSIKELKREVLEDLKNQTYENKNSNKDIRDMLDIKLQSMQKEVKESLKEMKDGNENKLNEIKNVVDEQLQTTLQKKVSESFDRISNQLAEVYKGLGEMTKLTSGVDNLNRVLSNVKTRGIFGEVALESLLGNIFTKEQYEAQVSIKRGREMVDFAIMLPGANKGDKVRLPIDAKFPLSDYERLVNASEGLDKVEIDRAKKELINRIKEEAKSISTKYIDPPHTTDFAIMYLPIEGLYAEVVKTPGLLEEMQSKYRVVVSGPTTLTALLNSLQMGFRTLQIRENSLEIGKLLNKFRVDFSKFTKNLENAQRQVGTVANTISDSIKRTQIISKKLDKLEGIELESGEIGYIEEVGSDRVEE